jgi:hypothetical protein
MSLEVSTLNVLLSGVVGLQCWIVLQVFKLSVRIARIETKLGLRGDTTRFYRKYP